MFAGGATFNNMPLHPLLVHFAVVLILLAACLAILVVVWPAARRRLGLIVPLVALVALVLTPITTNAGEALAATKRRINPALAQHMELGDQMIWWIAPLFLATAGFWAVHSFRRSDAAGVGVTGRRRGASVALAVVTVILAVGNVIWVYRIGDTGAQSVWLH